MKITLRALKIFFIFNMMPVLYNGKFYMLAIMYIFSCFMDSEYLRII